MLLLSVAQILQREMSLGMRRHGRALGEVSRTLFPARSTKPLRLVDTRPPRQGACHLRQRGIKQAWDFLMFQLLEDSTTNIALF